MANILLEEKNRTGTAVQRVQAVNILEQSGEVLKQAPVDPSKVPNLGVMQWQEYAQGRKT